MDRSLLSRFAAVTAFAAIVGVYSAPAQAVTFDYSQSTGWVFGTAATRNGPPPNIGGVEFFEPATNPNPALHPLPLGNAPPPNTFTTIGWGCAGNGDPTTCAPAGQNVIAGPDPMLNPARSALSIEGRAGEVTVNGDWEVITHLEHRNRAITGRTLSEITIASILRLSSNPPFTDLQTIEVSFTETLNRSTCPGPNPVGTRCDDFFSFNFGTFAPLTFVSDGIEYVMEFRLANFVNAAFLFDPVTGIGTIFTGERTTSEVDVEFRIREVPEPATLLLLGTGLVGLGAFSAIRQRRKR